MSSGKKGISDFYKMYVKPVAFYVDEMNCFYVIWAMQDFKKYIKSCR